MADTERAAPFARPWTWDTPAGTFSYHHVKTGLFHSYRSTEVSPGSMALVAAPEKALLDLVHLTPGGDSRACLAQLRLQNLDSLDLSVCRRWTGRGPPPTCSRSWSGSRSLR